MMLSERLGYLELDEARVDEDLSTLLGFSFDRAYQDYALGGWESCSLRNMSGDETDGRSHEYEGAARITSYGRAVPYLDHIATTHFSMEHCKAARIFVIRQGQLAPHRDYLEFGKGFTRVHLVLRTNPLAFNSEQSVVYQMRVGEIWYVDGSPVHSAANFSEEPRIHFVFDFDPEVPFEELTKGIQKSSLLAPIQLVERPELASEQRNAIHGLASTVDPDGLLLRHMIPFLARLHFFYDVSSRDTYGWLHEIAEGSGHEGAMREASAISQKFIGEAALASSTGLPELPSAGDAPSMELAAGV
jgi:hypothetical protein